MPKAGALHSNYRQLPGTGRAFQSRRITGTTNLRASVLVKVYWEHPNCANVSHKLSEQGSFWSRGENRFKFSWPPLHLSPSAPEYFCKNGMHPGVLIQL